MLVLKFLKLRYCIINIMVSVSLGSFLRVSCYGTVPSAIYEIFSEFLIFSNLFDEHLGE